MTVRLIAITPDAEKTMGYVARVSNPKNQDNPEVAKLLSYCIRNSHWSVFEHAFMTLEIQTSRTIARQILRHRGFTFSEFSQRYSEVTEGKVTVEARAPDSKNRQASHDTLPAETKEWFEELQQIVAEVSHNIYKEAIAKGIALECARALLPEGLTPSKLYVSGSIRNWIHFIELRSGNGTQLETQQIAEQCKAVFCEQLPTVAKALDWNKRSKD